MRFCTNCGVPVTTDGKKFCTTCGAPLQDDPLEAETQVAPTTALPPLAARPPVSPEPPVTPAAPVTPAPPAAPPAGADAERPTFVAPPGSWPPSQPPAGGTEDEPRSYVSPPGSWPPSQGPGYDSQQWLRPQPPAQPPGQDYRPAGPGRPGPPPRSGSTAAWIGFAAVIVLVLAGGGFAAWKFLGHHGAQHPAAGSSGSPNQGGSGVPPSSPTAAATTPAAAPTQAGFPVAVTASAAQGPDEQHVVMFLQSYFTAINDHNYGQYAPLLQPSQRPTVAQFNGGFSTTVDSAATLTGLAPTPTGVAATLKFTSHQSPSQSPTGTGCNTWRITLFLQAHGGGYRIGPAAPGYHAHYTAC